MLQAFPLNSSEILLAMATLFSMGLNWRFAASVSAMKLDIKTSADELRRELTQQLDQLRREFVPGALANEQRTYVDRRLETMDVEISKNREGRHELANKFSELILGPLQLVNTALTDKARRMAAFEERLRITEERVRDMRDHMTEWERKRE